MAQSHLVDLYEQDFQQWIVETVNRLSTRDFDTIEAKFGITIHPEEDYPQQCPFFQDQILDNDFYGKF